MNSFDPFALAICDAYKIGALISPPLKILGGRVHSCWKMETSSGTYVAKKISDYENVDHLRTAEKIAQTLAQFIPAIPALKQNQDFVFSFKNEHFLLFPFIEGELISLDKIQNMHVEKIAHCLAKIHNADIQVENAANPNIFIENRSHWRNLLNELGNEHPQARQLLTDHIALLENLHEEYLNYIPSLRNNVIISHHDIDPYNVLWNKKGDYFIIDWELSGKTNIYKDLVVTAIYWSHDFEFKIKPDFFTFFFKNYFKNSQKITSISDQEIKIGEMGLFGDWLNWLDYNFTRILKTPKNNEKYALSLDLIQNTLKGIPLIQKHLQNCAQLLVCAF